MIIYHVDLFIKNDIFNEFSQWLSSHIKKMLQFKGIESASIYYEHPDSDRMLNKNQQISKTSNDEKQLTVHYYIKTKEDLENYLTYHAAQMRQEGVKKFSDKFRAERKVLSFLLSS